MIISASNRRISSRRSSSVVSISGGWPPEATMSHPATSVALEKTCDSSWWVITILKQNGLRDANTSYDQNYHVFPPRWSVDHVFSPWWSLFHRVVFKNYDRVIPPLSWEFPPRARVIPPLIFGVYDQNIMYDQYKHEQSIIWSFDHVRALKYNMINWSCSPMVTWSCMHMINWSCMYMISLH